MIVFSIAALFVVVYGEKFLKEALQ